jgi:hypothetical protein
VRPRRSRFVDTHRTGARRGAPPPTPPRSFLTGEFDRAPRVSARVTSPPCSVGGRGREGGRRRAPVRCPSSSLSPHPSPARRREERAKGLAGEKAPVVARVRKPFRTASRATLFETRGARRTSSGTGTEGPDRRNPKTPGPENRRSEPKTETEPEAPPEDGRRNLEGAAGFGLVSGTLRPSGAKVFTWSLRQPCEFQRFGASMCAHIAPQAGKSGLLPPLGEPACPLRLRLWRIVL